MENGITTTVRIQAKYQVTLPPEIREYLQLKTGDKIAMWITEKGQVMLHNAKHIRIIPYVPDNGEGGNGGKTHTPSLSQKKQEVDKPNV